MLKASSAFAIGFLALGTMLIAVDIYAIGHYELTWGAAYSFQLAAQLIAVVAVGSFVVHLIALSLHRGTFRVQPRWQALLGGTASVLFILVFHAADWGWGGHRASMVKWVNLMLPAIMAAIVGYASRTNSTQAA